MNTITSDVSDGPEYISSENDGAYIHSAHLTSGRISVLGMYVSPWTGDGVASNDTASLDL